MKPHKWVGYWGVEEGSFCAVQKQWLVHLTMYPGPVFFKTEGGLCVNCTDKTLLIEHPLERWDKRCDISPRVNATLPNRRFLKQRRIGHTPPPAQ